MKGKDVFVTGANGGLGTYVTRAFLDVGASVIGVSRKILQSDFNHPNFTAMPAEISTLEGAKSVMDQVVARFGKLDVLVHTVGGFAGGQSIVDTDEATFRCMFDINLNSVFTFFGRRFRFCGGRAMDGSLRLAVGPRSSLA